MTVTTIDLDLKALDALKAKLGGTTRADVIRRALALLEVAADQSDKKTVSIGEGDQQVKVIL
jgi:hypothetical protein